VPLGPLEGVRVLDISNERGAYCTKLLADFGADVIRVEPPGGDPMRSWALSRRYRSTEGAFFSYYHANKRGITLDILNNGSQAILVGLLSYVDVLVLSNSVAELPVLADVLSSNTDLEDRLIIAEVTSFGGIGPHRHFSATHLTTYAMGGLMFEQGLAGQAPRVIPGVQMYDEAGLCAAIGILVSFRLTARLGGQKVEVAAQEVMASQMHNIQRYASASVIAQRRGSQSAPPSGTWTCAEGQVEFQVWEARQWSRFLELFENPEDLNDPTLADRMVRRERAEYLRPIVAREVARHRAVDLVNRAQSIGVPCSLVNQPQDVWRDPNLRQRGFFVKANAAGPEMPGSPYRLPESMWSIRKPAPMLGQHNREVFEEELGILPDELRELEDNGLV